MGKREADKSHISVSSTEVAMKILRPRLLKLEQSKYKGIQTAKALPKELWNKEILPYLSDTDKSHLTQTCQNAYALGCVSDNGQTFYNKHLHTTANQVKTLLLHVARGEQAEAEAMIQKDPGLLLERGQTKDYSERTIEGTALQIALGAEDVKYRDDEICMAEMVRPYLENLPNGKEILAAQIREQFPEGWEKEEKAREQRDSAALNKVVDAIAHSTDNNPCEEAIQAFRDYLEQENKSKVYQTGKHFNINLLIEAFELYDKKYSEFGGYTSRKNNLLWRNVLGYTQRFLPTCYAQAFCQGIDDIVDNRKKLNRDLKFCSNSGVSFYPLDSDPAFRLGFDYCADGGAGRGAAARFGWWRLGEWSGHSAEVQNYVKQKTSTCQRFISRAASHTTNYCIVM